MINRFKACQYNMTVDRRCDTVGNHDPDFDQGWSKAEGDERRSNPFLNLYRGDKRPGKEIQDLRAKVALHILTLNDGALAGLSHRGAIARYRASRMLYAYYRFDSCLNCPTWLELSKSDIQADELLRHLLALVIGLREPVPIALLDWASAALFVDHSRRPGRPGTNWRRDQKITLAVDVLVKLTNSSADNALYVVSEVCRENGIVDMYPEGIKNICDRVKREAKKGQADGVGPWGRTGGLK